MKYRKYKSYIKQNISLLQEFYHVEGIKNLILAFLEDMMTGFLINSGSGLSIGLWRGSLARILIRSKFPLFIGKRFKIIHPKNLHLGHHVWIRDDITINAYGSMIIGNDCVIGERSELYSSGNKGLVIRNNVGIGKNCYIAQLGGPLRIGNNVLIADSVRIYTLSHKYDNPNMNIIDQGYTIDTIEIEDNVWIGSGAIIFNSVKIGKGSVIGANAVVTKSIPSYSLVGGVPAKIIRSLI
jgi:galactoside O-acetyltransferase